MASCSDVLGKWYEMNPDRDDIRTLLIEVNEDSDCVYTIGDETGQFSYSDGRLSLTCVSGKKVPPAGFIALRYNDGEPIRRYHFALADRMNTPEIDTYVDVCIPGDVRINKIGCNLYVSGHYGIRQYGRSP